MRKTRKFWVAVLLGLLAVVTVAGIALAASNRAPEAQSVAAVSRFLTVPASSCYAAYDGEEYDNWGTFLRGDDGTGLQSFICPVDFPNIGIPRTITSVTMYCYDNRSGSGSQYNVVAQVSRIAPNTANEVLMGTVGSSGASGTDPQAITISGAEIDPNLVYPSQAVYLWVSMGGSSKLKLYGFRIDYDLP